MDTASLTFMIVILVVLVIISAFFSASETAFSSLNKIRIKSLANEGNKRAKTALFLEERFDKLLVTILIGNNAVNLASSSIATLLFVELLQDEAAGALIATVVMLIVLLIFGEITPKSLAKKNSERIALMFTPALYVLVMAFTPISIFFTALTKLVSRRNPDTPTMTEDELVVMIDEIQEEGILEQHEGELIRSAIEFDDIFVDEVLTPRVDVIAADKSVSESELKDIFRKTGYSRIPIYDGTIDRIVGVVSAKDFFNKCYEFNDMQIKDIVRPIRFVAKTTTIATVLSDLQKSKVHMAVVLDSYGGTLGIVSLEDIIEELVGEIWDESDDVQYPITQEVDGSYTVLGEANIYDVMEEMGLKFNPEEYRDHSVNGYLHYKLDKVPIKNDLLELEGLSVIVKTVKGNRVMDAVFIPKPLPPEEEEEHGFLNIR